MFNALHDGTADMITNQFQVGADHLENKSLEGHIFLIEESPLATQAYCARLGHAGFEVEVCAVPGEANQRLYCQRFDLIILSLQLPEEDYLSIVQGLQTWSTNRETPLLALLPKTLNAEPPSLQHGGPIQYAEHRNTCSPALVETARGMIANRAKSLPPKLRLLESDRSE